MFRFRPDIFTILLIATVLIASLLPCRGEAAVFFEGATTAAIVLLFFMHGAKLSREAVIGGLSVWRLHLAVFASTYVLFPILGVALTLLPDGLLDPEIKMGMMFLCKIGREACRERVCQYVYISVVDLSLKKNKNIII